MARSGRRPKTNGFRSMPRSAQQTHREKERQAIRAQALLRYARIEKGQPVMCNPPTKVAQARVNAGLWTQRVKVIFKSVEDAEAFAQVLYGLDGTIQTAYPCEYSRHGHAHLTTVR